MQMIIKIEKIPIDAKKAAFAEKDAVLVSKKELKAGGYYIHHIRSGRMCKNGDLVFISKQELPKEIPKVDLDKKVIKVKAAYLLPIYVECIRWRHKVILIEEPEQVSVEEIKPGDIAIVAAYYNGVSRIEWEELLARCGLFFKRAGEVGVFKRKAPRKIEIV